MKLKLKKFTAYLLTLCMLMAFVPGFTQVASALSNDLVKTWEIGKTNPADVVAKLYTNAADNTMYDLVISGTGEMATTPWKSNYKDKIVSVTVENGVTNIYSYAFDEATALKTVTLADSVKELSYYAFMDCTSLTRVDLNQVKKLNTFAFANCDALEHVDLGAVESISSTAFQGCISLEQVHIPATATTIEPRAFANCTNLSSFTVAAGNTTYSAKDGVLFSKDGKTLKIYPFGNDATSYSVPETVTAIGNEAFYNVPALEEVIIPNHETTVGTSAIIRNGKITTIKAHNNSPAKIYADSKSDNIAFESICTYDNAQDTSCNVCQYEENPHANHTICGAQSCSDDHNLDGTPDNHGAIQWTAWDGTMPFPGGNVYLTQNVTYDGYMYTSVSGTLCLNGYKIDLGSKYLTISRDTEFNLCDCKGTGSIVGTASNVLNINTNAILNMYGATVSGGNNFGAIELSQRSSIFHMYGGNVNGTIYGITAYGTAEIYDGNISGTEDGISNLGGTINIKGGTIKSDNNGVYNLSGTINITGGEIYGDSYGILNYKTFNLGKAPKVTGATAGIYNATAEKINITDALDFQAPISIKRYNGNVFTDGWNTYMANAAISDYFVSTETSYTITKDAASGELVFAVIPKVTYTWNGDNCTIELDFLEDDVITMAASYNVNKMNEFVRLDDKTKSATLTGDTIKVFYWKETVSPVRGAVELTRP